MSPDTLCIKTFITKKSEGQSEQGAISVKCQLPAFLTTASLSDNCQTFWQHGLHSEQVRTCPGRTVRSRLNKFKCLGWWGSPFTVRSHFEQVQGSPGPCTEGPVRGEQNPVQRVPGGHPLTDRHNWKLYLRHSVSGWQWRHINYRWACIVIMNYRSGTVNSNMVNSKVLLMFPIIYQIAHLHNWPIEPFDLCWHLP